ncbi:MAG: hypothetical protein V3T23_03175 [Nitrososphaerales archaeon]
MGGPRVQKEEVSTQATPLAENFLKVLQGQLDEGAFGTGVTGAQRESGTALRQFISSLQSNIGAPGTPSAGAQRLIGGLETQSRARTERSAGDLRESQGILGARFGSSLTQGEALLRTEADANLDQLIGSILEQSRQFDEGIRLQNQELLLGGISQLFGQGQANIEPFREALRLGVQPEETIVSPSTGTQLITAGTGILDAFIPG